MRRALALALGACVAMGAGPLLAQAELQVRAGAWGAAGSSGLCERARPLTAGEQGVLLRFAAVVREELDAAGDGALLISRSGLDLSRFGLRYSHAAIVGHDAGGSWFARQLYFACDEGRPRLYDQGIAGFAMGVDDPALGYISIVRLPRDAAESARRAALDDRLAVQLLSASYSADAYPFSVRHQNCNQWVVELLAAAWGSLEDGDDLRGRAQAFLRQANYEPGSVDVGSHLLMFAATFVPFIRLDDHPEEDRFALRLRISLPASVEAFAHQRFAASERIELCHRGGQVVVHRGWTPVAEGCIPAEGDRVLQLD